MRDFPGHQGMTFCVGPGDVPRGLCVLPAVFGQFTSFKNGIKPHGLLCVCSSLQSGFEQFRNGKTGRGVLLTNASCDSFVPSRLFPAPQILGKTKHIENSPSPLDQRKGTGVASDGPRPRFSILQSVVFMVSCQDRVGRRKGFFLPISFSGLRREVCHCTIETAGAQPKQKTSSTAERPVLVRHFF